MRGPLQRRRLARDVKVFQRKRVTDLRGNVKITTDWGNPITVKGTFLPERGSSAELAGQQEILNARLLVGADAGNIGTWSVIEIAGRQYDVTSPARYHHGTPQTRHYEVDLRIRPGVSL